MRAAPKPVTGQIKCEGCTHYSPQGIWFTVPFGALCERDNGQRTNLKWFPAQHKRPRCWEARR